MRRFWKMLLLAACVLLVTVGTALAQYPSNNSLVMLRGEAACNVAGTARTITWFFKFNGDGFANRRALVQTATVNGSNPYFMYGGQLLVGQKFVPDGSTRTVTQTVGATAGTYTLSMTVKYVTVDALGNIVYGPPQTTVTQTAVVNVGVCPTPTAPPTATVSPTPTLVPPTSTPVPPVKATPTPSRRGGGGKSPGVPNPTS